MKLFKHLLQNPFILATGMAALAHSTWSLCTLFSGTEPDQFTGAWWAWIIPGLLIAFALDVGQIATSTEIRAGQRRPIKYVTFGIFSLATYYLQWVYIAHHMPSVSLGAGVRAEWLGVATLFRDLAVWFVPALLPLSTLLYTLSESDPVGQNEQKDPEPDYQPRVVIVDYKDNQIDSEKRGDTELEKPGILPSLESGSTPIVFKCPDCEFTGTYDNARSAAQAERAHARRHQKAVVNS